MSTENQFRNIVDDYLKQFFAQLLQNHQLERCEDQFVGYVTVEDGKVVSGPALNSTKTDFKERVPLSDWERDICTSARRVMPQIIIQTLESPHKDEYLPVGKPPRPAAGFRSGQTGSGLSRFYDRAYPVHRHKLVNGKYALLLVNAVPYQCSLGVDPKAHRTELFNICWAGFGRDSYMDRIINLYRLGDIVINSCTADGLRERVQDALKEAIKTSIQRARESETPTKIPKVEIIKLVHPCNWQRIARQGGKFEWGIGTTKV